MTLEGRTVLISGGSRGIGAAIALRAARDGAHVALLAKTGSPHATLPGTVQTAAAAVEAAGGRALPLIGDVRDDEFVERSIATVVDRFGGIDVVVNNASAIDLSGTGDLTMKSYDLMQDINVRGAFHLSKAAIPHLRHSDRPHILTLSPPLRTARDWIGSHTGYMISKFGMSLVALGLSVELEDDGIAVNGLWPRTMIATAALRRVGDRALATRARTPEIMADAAYLVITADFSAGTGRLLIDEEVLRAHGRRDADFASYLGGAATEAGLADDLWMAPAVRV